METKSAPWGGGAPKAPTHTLEVKIGPAAVWRFHRDERGHVWLRIFEWRDIPPGYWAAGPPRELTRQEREQLLRIINETDTEAGS